MAVKLEKDLQPNNRDLWRRAREAFDAKNYGYVLNLGQTILKSEPEFLEARQRNRAASIQQFKTLSTFAKPIEQMKASRTASKASSAVKKAPAEALVYAEEALAIDPFCSSANTAQAEAAIALSMPEIAALAYETMRENKPKDTKLMHQLAQTYMLMDDGQRASKVYEAILQIDPRDGEALSGMKNATALAASTAGGWRNASDYRDLIQDKKQAAALEQQGKVVKSEKAIDEQIAELFTLVQREPANLKHPLRIAELFLKKPDLDQALEWYQYTFEQGGRSDTSIEKTLSDLRIKKLDKQIAEYEAAAATDPAQYQSSVDLLKQRRAEAMLEIARERVRKYPNDGQYRYDLGAALFHAGNYKEALPELQQSLKQPAVRIKAFNMMGLCFARRNMNDMAEKTLRDAIAEVPIMDDLKKEMCYNLAMVYKAVDKKEAMIEYVKKIYEVDMGYKDVGKIIEDYYDSGSGS
ncbi:hypothetical protein DB346_18265 [Verrucomicrobia bacterium LW23]|nr:hypothetical protein DB346_18265 [Verrucomicrobia bacterium LW23]